MSAYFFLFCYIMCGRKECVTRCFKAKEEETWIGEITSKFVKMRYCGAHRTRILQFKRSSLMTTITFFFFAAHALSCTSHHLFVTFIPHLLLMLSPFIIFQLPGSRFFQLAFKPLFEPISMGKMNF